jgi:DNA (cytosine-5)-methyltransferase 1
MSPRLLDLFCGAGGAAQGYADAGFEVIGIDIEPQLRYPFECWKADALDPLVTSDAFLRSFDAIHASPPCPAYSAARFMGSNWEGRPDLLPLTRDLLESTGRPYVIENVPGAPMRRDLTLCGAMFGLTHDGWELRRHRLFEISGFRVSQPGPCRHELPVLGVYGHAGGRQVIGQRRGNRATITQARAIMGVDWMTAKEAADAVPPAYTAHIGRALMRSMEHE